MALLASARWARLSAAQPEGTALWRAAGWADVEALVEAGAVRLLLVDPLAPGWPGTAAVARLRRRASGVAVMVYTAFTPDVASDLLALGRLQVARVLFERHDDAPAALRSALAAELRYTALLPLVSVLAEWTRRLPLSVRQALEGMLVAPLAAITVEALARHAGVSRRTCERWFLRAGLPAPRVVVGVVRSLAALRLLEDPSCTVADAARRVGFGDPRPLQAWSRATFGMSAAAVRRELSWEQAVAQVRARYFPADERRVS